MIKAAVSLKKIIAYILASLIGFVLWLLVLKFAKQAMGGTLFFLGLEVLLVVSICYFFAFKLLLEKHLLTEVWDSRDSILTLALIASVCVNFLIIVPVTIDRSVTVFVLSYLNDRYPNYVSKDELKQVLKEVYVDQYDAAGRRIGEQEPLGFVSRSETGAVQITESGRTFIRLSRFVADSLDLDKRITHPTNKAE